MTPYMMTLPSPVSHSEAADRRELAYQRNHKIAESLQKLLLHTRSPETLPGLAVETFYEAALEEALVGGDSCDAFALAGGRVALAVADASGKGLEAAERVAEIRFALRAFLQEHSEPSMALSCLNDFVCDAGYRGRSDDSAFATLSLAVMDSATGETHCLCAGGEAPLVLRAGGIVEVVQICGTALGLFPSQGYAAALITLAPGDTLLLATDGITESRKFSFGGTRGGPFLGLDGMAQLASHAHQATATLCHLGRAIFEGARAFAGGTFHDDACLLVGRRK